MSRAVPGWETLRTVAPRPKVAQTTTIAKPTCEDAKGRQTARADTERSYGPSLND